MFFCADIIIIRSSMRVTACLLAFSVQCAALKQQEKKWLEGDHYKRLSLCIGDARHHSCFHIERTFMTMINSVIEKTKEIIID